MSALRSIPRQWAGERRSRMMVIVVAAAVLLLSFVLGQRASFLWLGVLVVALGGLVVLARPLIGVFAVIVTALVPRLEFGTGTEVQINTVTLLIPAMAAIWLVDTIRRRKLRLVESRTNLPLILFLAAGLVSLAIGRATWDPLVPAKSNFLLVQLAQWGIFAFSALAFWLMANLVTTEAVLWRCTALFLLLAGSVAILRLVPGFDALLGRVTTLAFIRTPLWVLLTALAGGQLLFNRQLPWGWRLFLGAALVAAVVYAFVDRREAVSDWTGLGAALGTLIWLRFPRLRWPLVSIVVLLVAAGLLFPAVYEFAGGEAEWTVSGGSRLTLIGRVIDVTMRNPITGLGPAAYRPYAAMEPLRYGGGNWLVPMVNSHNNYVDIFSQTGIVGLGLFLWFMLEVARLGWRLRHRVQSGFAAGYVHAMLAAWVAMMLIMMLLDWFLPFVYDVGFPGLQASVLVWLFLGGLVAMVRWLQTPVTADPVQ